MPSYADPSRILREVYAALGRPSQQELHYQDVNAARIAAGFRVLRAIASNPSHSDYGSYTALVTVAHNSLIPQHDGEVGVPIITPYDGAPDEYVGEGQAVTPDVVDSYRAEKAGGLALYTIELDPGVALAHDQADQYGVPSPISKRYSIVGGRFKFTGHSAQIPMVQVTRTLADAGVPESFEDTVVKLTIPGLEFVAKNKQYAGLAAVCLNLGMTDLVEIKGGAVKVPPMPTPEKLARMASAQG